MGAYICEAILHGIDACSSNVAVESVCFKDCDLSEHAEQQLLATLEQCDGSDASIRCLVTIDGGTTICGEFAQGFTVGAATKSTGKGEDDVRNAPRSHAHSSM